MLVRLPHNAVLRLRRLLRITVHMFVSVCECESVSVHSRRCVGGVGGKELSLACDVGNARFVVGGCTERAWLA